MRSAPPVSQVIYDPYERLAGGSGTGGLASFYDVRTYGAATGFDLAAPLLAAVAAADAAGGGTVLVPTSYPISAATISVTNPVTILGLPGTTLTQYDANNLSPVLSLISSNITLDGLHITGSVAAGHEADEGIGCVQLTYAGAPITLDGIAIRNCRCDGKNGGIESYNGAAAFALTNLLLERNTIRTLHLGIYIGPYGRNAVVNDRITARFNDIEVSAIGGYANYEYARPLWIVNTNNQEIHNNRSIGGFGGIETFGGGVSGPRPRQRNVNIYDNEIDSHLGYTQVDGGRCAGNVVDMGLRNPAWPKFDAAAPLASWSYLPGIEASDSNDVVVSENVVRGTVGAGIDFSGNTNSRLVDNVVNGTGKGTLAAPPSYADGIHVGLIATGCTISGNHVYDAWASGILQQGDQNWYAMAECSIDGNYVHGAQNHGIHIRNATGLSVKGNQIFGVNGPTPGGYNGINFSPTFGGDLLRQLECSNNVIGAGATYGIRNDFVELAESRANIFSDNTVRDPRTDGYFLISGRRHHNISNQASIAQGLIAATLQADTRPARDLFTFDPGGATSFTGLRYGSLGDEVTIDFARADSTVVNGSGFTLSGSANVIPTAGSTMKFLCINDNNPVAQAWRETSRTIV